MISDRHNIERNSPTILRNNVEDRARRHRGVPNSSFETTSRKRYDNRNVESSYPPQNHFSRGFQSRSFLANKEENDVNESYETTVRFQRNLPFRNVPELNPPFGENGDNFMEFLSQISSNNRPFGDIGFGERSDKKTEDVGTTKLIPQFKKSQYVNSLNYPSEYYSDKQVVTSEDKEPLSYSVRPSFTATTTSNLVKAKSPPQYYDTTKTPRRRTSLNTYPSQKLSKENGFQDSNLSILNEISNLQKSYKNNNEVAAGDYNAYYDQRQNRFTSEKSSKRKSNSEVRYKNTPLPLAYDPNKLYNSLQNDITDGYEEAYSYNKRLRQQEAYNAIQSETQEPVQPNSLINPYQYPTSQTKNVIATPERNIIADHNKPLRFPSKQNESNQVKSTFNPSELSQKINERTKVQNTARNYYKKPFLESYHHTLKSYREPIGSNGNKQLSNARAVEHVTARHVSSEELAARSVQSLNDKVTNSILSSARTKPSTTTTTEATTPTSRQTSKVPTSTHLTTEQLTSTRSDIASISKGNEINTTPKTRVIYTPGPVYYKDMPLVTSTPDPGVILDKLTAPVNDQPHKQQLRGIRNRAKGPRYHRKEGKGPYHRRKELPRKLDNAYYYRDVPHQDRETSIPIRYDRLDVQNNYRVLDEQSTNDDADGYYTYQNHPKKDIDGNPDNDWIPILTRKNDLVRHRLQKSPLKKLVSNVKESLFRSDTSVSTAAAISLPYLALALPN